MIKLFVFSSALFLFAGCFCQSLINLPAAKEEHCAFKLPADVKEASENLELSDGVNGVWVKKGVTLTIRRGNNKIYAEPKSIINILGGTNTVYLKKGAEIIIDGGTCMIHCENRSEITKNTPGFPGIKFWKKIDFDYSLISDLVSQNQENKKQEQQALSLQETENDSFPRDISVVIPNNVQIINDSFEKTRASGKNYWLCNSAKTAHIGANNLIFLETGAELKLTGAGNKVYLKKGAVFSLKAGNDNEIHYETGADIISESRRNKNEYVKINSLKYKFGKADPCQKIMEIKEEIDLTPGEYIATDTEIAGYNEMAIISEPDLQVQLPESRKDINGVLRAVDSNKKYYIHTGAKYTHSGNDNLFFVEKGGKLKIISGKNNTVYLENGAQVHFYFPFKNKVIYAKGAVISFENDAAKDQVAFEEHEKLSFKKPLNKL